MVIDIQCFKITLLKHSIKSLEKKGYESYYHESPPNILFMKHNEEDGGTYWAGRWY